jgi:phenylpropionate dioxygenase-like ring-hydroxylating dioxygenase large terminal subunit
MLSKDQEQLLTRVGPGTPMAKLFREYWVPAVRSGALVANGAPKRVRLFGENYVAFRAADGRVGFFDEACPHRRASLALARSGDNALRCIYHGWKIDVSGRVVDAPAEGTNPRLRQFLDSVAVKPYPMHEAGGMVWVYLGARDRPPAFPEFEFTRLTAGRVHVRRAELHYNWLQGFEAHLDAAHLPILHSSLLRDAGSIDRDVGLALANAAPDMELESTAYGFHEAALRSMPDGSRYARMRHVILPCFTFVPTAPGSPCSGRAIVPIDDEHTAEWYFLYHPERAISGEEIETQWRGAAGDDDNFAANLGSVENLWHQDRHAMERGHWTGFTRCVPFEDFSVSSSMGVFTDRTKERLGPSDAVLVHARKALLDALDSFSRTGVVPWQSQAIDFGAIRATTRNLAAGEDWRKAA